VPNGASYCSNEHADPQALFPFALKFTYACRCAFA